jgi:glyoxylase-like metal-dependent hydrolase (beta-lactamase superfamily II)
MDFLTLRYRSVNCYLFDVPGGLFAFDAGWPGSLREYRDALKGLGRRLEEIRIFAVSHFHIDHAGLAGEWQSRGAAFISFPEQIGAIGEMEELIARKGYPYLPIDRSSIEILDPENSRVRLASIEFQGEFLKTDGHGGQSVTLLADSGDAFCGDLPPPAMIGDYDGKSRLDWERLKAKGARRAHPAHGEGFAL